MLKLFVSYVFVISLFVSEKKHYSNLKECEILVQEKFLPSLKDSIKFVIKDFDCNVYPFIDIMINGDTTNIIHKYVKIDTNGFLIDVNKLHFSEKLNSFKLLSTLCNTKSYTVRDSTSNFFTIIATFDCCSQGGFYHDSGGNRIGE